MFDLCNRPPAAADQRGSRPGHPDPVTCTPVNAAAARVLTPVTTLELTGLVQRLGVQAPAADDAERIEQIALLERVKGAAAAAQARVTVAFDDSQRQLQQAQGVPAGQVGRGVADQIALARRDAPFRGSRHLGLASALVREMPATLATLARGQISEWRATIMVRETAVLTLEHRAVLDARLGPFLAGLSDRQVQARARSLAYALDATAPIRRARTAASDRRVSIRPAPDTMALVTGYLPAAQGVATYQALNQHARSLRTQGDSRSLGQIMADTFAERLTGQHTAHDVPLEIQLVMTDATLLGGDDAPGRIPGYGPVPAAIARDLARGPEAADPPTGDRGAVRRARRWLRRLYAAPEDGTLVAMDRRRRLFDGALKDLLIARDQDCRTPWCGAPIRHADHALASRLGGETSRTNGQGLCERCNQVKETPGWATTVSPTAKGSPTIIVTTPTGHSYHSTAPPLLPTTAPPLLPTTAPAVQSAPARDRPG